MNQRLPSIKSQAEIDHESGPKPIAPIWWLLPGAIVGGLFWGSVFWGLMALWGMM